MAAKRIDPNDLKFNQPKRTPNHPTKSHVVKVKDGDEVKIIRFGEQGAKTAGKPKKGESDAMKAKRKAFKARHAKNIAKGPTSAAYWADKWKWTVIAFMTFGSENIINAFDQSSGFIF
jgi:hypothetical protein